MRLIKFTFISKDKLKELQDLNEYLRGKVKDSKEEKLKLVKKVRKLQREVDRLDERERELREIERRLDTREKIIEKERVIKLQEITNQINIEKECFITKLQEYDMTQKTLELRIARINELIA